MEAPCSGDRSAVLERGVQGCQRHRMGERPVTLWPPHLLICPGSCALTLLFSLCIGFKSASNALKRTTKSSLVSRCLGLTAGMSGSCQLLFIKAKPWSRTGALANWFFPPLLPFLLFYALIYPEFTFGALSPYPALLRVLPYI